MNRNKKGFTLVELLVVIGILGILMGALFPAISSAMVKANLSACGMRGRNLFVAITAANTEREALGLGNVWPKTEAQEGADSATDPIGSGQGNTAEKYFQYLFDTEKMGQQDWKPYITGVDLSVLFGAGVPPAGDPKQLKAKNILWSVAANVTDEVDDVVPVLVSRNFPASKLKVDEYDGTANEEFKLGKASGDGASDTPFGNKAFVIIRKGGGVIQQTSRYATEQIVYSKNAFKIPETEGAKFQYLEPAGN